MAMAPIMVEKIARKLRSFSEVLRPGIKGSSRCLYLISSSAMRSFMDLSVRAPTRRQGPRWGNRIQRGRNVRG